MEGKKGASQQGSFLSLTDQIGNLPLKTGEWTLLPAESHFFHQCDVVGPVVVDEDADGTGHQGEGQSGHDASVWYGGLQLAGPSAEDEQQQGHHSQGGNAGAGRHDNAGM